MTGNVPECGLYEGIDFPTYRAWPYMNGTLLFSGKTPAHMRAVLDGRVERDDSKDLKFGRALHVRLCEPERYADDILVAATCSVPLKSGDRKGAPCGKSGKYLLDGEWYCGTHAPKEGDTLLAQEPLDYVSVEEAVRIEEIAEQVRQNDVVRLLRMTGGFEASGVFDYRGVRMKCRLDKNILPGPRRYPAIVDIKKTQWGKGDDASFRKAIEAHNYHCKAALYDAFFRWLTGEPPNFIWLVIEDTYPYCINIVQADDNWLEIGRRELDRKLDLWRKCQETGEYPGYAREIHFIGPPNRLLEKHNLRGVDAI